MKLWICEAKGADANDDDKEWQPLPSRAARTEEYGNTLLDFLNKYGRASDRDVEYRLAVYERIEE